jgi:hypothetical protein
LDEELGKGFGGLDEKLGGGVDGGFGGELVFDGGGRRFDEELGLGLNVFEIFLAKFFKREISCSLGSLGSSSKRTFLTPLRRIFSKTRLTIKITTTTTTIIQIVLFDPVF